ncbi:MAG: hypothetical protein HKK66_09620 [Chlorobiaceae bacterium]|nr:hypothetical protein [Chlorobiaceae bacterium]
MSAINVYTCSTCRGFEHEQTASAVSGCNAMHFLYALHSMIGIFVTVVIASPSIALL